VFHAAVVQREISLREAGREADKVQGVAVAATGSATIHDHNPNNPPNNLRMRETCPPLNRFMGPVDDSVTTNTKHQSTKAERRGHRSHWGHLTQVWCFLTHLWCHWSQLWGSRADICTTSDSACLNPTFKCLRPTFKVNSDRQIA